MANTRSQVVQGIHFRLKLDELIQQREMPLQLSNVDKGLCLLTPNIEGHWECELGCGATHGGWLGDAIRYCPLAGYIEKLKNSNGALMYSSIQIECRRTHDEHVVGRVIKAPATAYDYTGMRRINDKKPNSWEEKIGGSILSGSHLFVKAEHSRRIISEVGAHGHSFKFPNSNNDA